MLSYVDNGMGGESEVIIEDNGDGINFASLEDTFGTFLASQKSGLSLQLKSRANKGKGRFSFSAFALNATWETTFSDENSRKTYKIIHCTLCLHLITAMWLNATFWCHNCIKYSRVNQIPIPHTI